MSKQQLIQQAEQIRDEYRIGANSAERVGNALLAIIHALSEADVEELSKFFLRKDREDTATRRLTLLGGVKVGKEAYINEKGNAVLKELSLEDIKGLFAEFDNLKVDKGNIAELVLIKLLVKALADVEELNVKETATILNAVVKASLSSPKFTSGFLGEGFRLAKTENGDWNLEIDNLTVRKVFQVFELLIQEVKHQGGVVVHSPAGGKITKVTDGGSYWRCEIESADTFFKDDLVLCQKFTGKIKRYWRAVTSAGDGYINLSKTDCEANSAIPEVDDEIATLGNKTNTARQSAYLISVVGADAPYTAYYSGINSYSLKGKEHTRIGNLEGVVSPVFGQLEGHGALLENAYIQGVIKLQNGKTVESVIDETSDKLSGDINNVNTSVNSVKSELVNTITNAEEQFNTGINQTKTELSSNISSVKQELEGKINTDIQVSKESIAKQITQSQEEAEAAAKAYTDAQDKAKLTQAKSYADGKVTAEEKRAIADANAKLAAAKKYADAQDNLLKTQQEAYADGKVTESEKRAIADATNKVNAAKSELNALVSKAQSTADDAKSAIDNLEFGGRNLLLNSAFANSPIVYASGRNTIVSKDFNRLEYITTPNVNAGFIFQFSQKLEEGTNYILSFSIESDKNTSLNYLSKRVGVNNNSGSSSTRLSDEYVNSGKNNVLIELLGDGNTNGIWIGSNQKDEVTFIISNLKLEKGTKATDWTEAPEDVEDQIAKSKEEAEVAAKAYADAQDNLKQIESKAYADDKVTAEEERAIADAKAKLDVAKAYAEAQDAVLKTQQEAYADGKITAEEQRAIEDAKAKLEAAKAYAEAQDEALKVKTDAYADGIVTEAEQRAIDEAQNRVDKAKNELNALIEGVEFSVTKKITDTEQTFLSADGKITSHIKETTQLVTEAQLANGESVETLEQVKVQINDLEITASEFDSTLGEITKKQGEIEGSISNLNQTASSISASVEGFKETETAIKETANRIEATHEGIVLEASEKSAKKAIDDLEIGGRNLMYKSRQNTSSSWCISPYHFNVVSNTRSSVGIFYGRDDIDVQPGDVFVLSYYLKTEPSKNGTNECAIRVIENGSTKTYLYPSNREWAEGWTKHHHIIRATDETTSVWPLQIYNYRWAKGDDGEYLFNPIAEYKDIKLEKGNKPTDWTPAPEDIEDKIETTRTEFDSKLEITKEAITATSTKVDGLTGRVQETEAKLEPDRLWVAVKDNSQKLIDDLDTVNRNYAYIDEYNYICLSNDFPRNKKQYLSLSLWGNFEEFANADPFSEIFFGGRFDSPFLDYKYTRKSVNHIVYEGGYVDLSLETNKDLALSLYGMAPEELITKVKIDLGTKATDWTPAPEELLTPEDIKASIELTTNGLDVFGKHHSLEGKVTFASLASDAQGKINSAQSTANTALTNANSAGSNLTTLQGRLGELAYEDMVERAKLGSTIIEGSYLRTELIEAKSITAEKIDVDSIFANRIRTGNLDVLEGATIGSFEIGNGRIGVKIDDPTSASFGNLAIYSDFFRVGGSNGYVMFGDNVIPASSGGAFTATGRIVNKRTNKGSDWGYDTSNYGLFIDVTGGTKNYGISSNAPLKAPAFINTAVGIIDFVGSSTTYSIDFSQHSIFLMYADRNVNVDLPSESRVANYFSLRTLPNDFGFLFYVKAREGSRNIILRNIYNSNEKQQNYELTAGNSIPILVTKSPTFRYQALTKMWV